MVISASLQACGVVFPFAMLTSICRSIVTICSGLYLWMGMTVFPPSGFSLIPPGTNLAGHVSKQTKLDWLEVRWPQPSNLVEHFSDLPIDRYITIVEGQGKRK